MPIPCGFAGSAYDTICRLLTADFAIQVIKNRAAGISAALVFRKMMNR